MKVMIFAVALLARISALSYEDDTRISYQPKLQKVSYGKCTESNECYGAPFYVCDSGTCYHKPVFPPLPLEYGGYITVAIMMGLCNVGGIGGGAIDQPILQTFFKFEVKEAIAVSSFVILLGAIARFIYNLRTMNPDKPYTVVVDYSLATIMISTTLAGSQIGNQLFLKVFPPLIIQICLEMLFLFLAIQSFFKARSIHKQELAARLIEDQPGLLPAPKTNLNLTTSSSQFEADNFIQNDSSKITINNRQFDWGTSVEQLQELQALQKLAIREKGHGQWLKQLICFSLISICIVMNLSLGSGAKDSIDGVVLCGVVYWMIQLVFIIICCVVTYLAVKLNKREQDLRKKYKVNFIEGEPIFEGRNLVKLLMIGFGGGWVAGALGLGGASIYNPALLAMGVNPKVAASTGMYLVIFSCLNSCVVNFVSQILDLKYGLFVGLWCVVGSLLGLFLADHFVKKSGKLSIFVFILSLVFFISAGVTPYVAYNQLSSQKKAGYNIMAFSSPC